MSNPESVIKNQGTIVYGLCQAEAKPKDQSKSHYPAYVCNMYKLIQTVVAFFIAWFILEPRQKQML